jgi:hypothetical protein
VVFKLTMAGQVAADPATTGETSGFSPTIDLAFSEKYAAVWGGAQPIDNDALDPFVVPLGAITKVRAIALRAVDGQSLVVKLSSSAGADQALLVSDTLIVRAQNTGDHYTAVKIEGEGRIEYLLGGDL